MNVCSNGVHSSHEYDPLAASQHCSCSCWAFALCSDVHGEAEVKATGRPALFLCAGGIPLPLLPALSLLMLTAPATMVLMVEGERSGFEEAEAWAQSVSPWAWAVRTQLEIPSEVPVQSS